MLLIRYRVNFRLIESVSKYVLDYNRLCVELRKQLATYNAQKEVTGRSSGDIMRVSPPSQGRSTASMLLIFFV